LIVLFASVGITSLTNQVERVSECIPQTANEVCSAKSVPSPAKNAGIVAGDKIVKVNGLSYQEWSEVVEVIRSSAGKQLDITIDRNGSLINILVTPASRELDGKEIGVLGVVNQVGTITYGPLTAIAKGGSFTIDILQNSVQEINLNLIDGNGAPASTTGYASVVNIFDVAGTAVTSYTPTVEYSDGGILNFELDTDVTSTIGRYNLIVALSGSGFNVKYGPLQILVRPL
jgi:RIP metalloprotease RseP